MYLAMEFIFVFIVGSMIGSFLNVCIYRMPKGESIVFPSSHCTKCNYKIKWYENIPIISYIFLLGKCKQCKEKISIIYPVVELLTASVAIILYYYFGLTPKFFIYFVLFASLIVCSFIDFDVQLIPDIITLPGIVIGLICAGAYPELLAETRLDALKESFLGILAGGGSLFALGVIGELIFKKEAMGGGDVKLLAMIGAFVGWEIAILVFFIAPVFGAVAGIIIKIKTGKELIPYGPYLVLASFLCLLYSDKILRVIFWSSYS